MKKIIACSFAVVMGLSAQYVSATTQEELGNLGSYLDSVLNPNQTDTANTTGTTYKTHQPPSVNQAGDALHYLAFSEYVYKSWGAPRGWTLAETVHDSSTGFHAVVYTSGSNAVIAFRGSELGTSDWVNNGIMAGGAIPPQYRMAMSESVRLANRYGQYSIHYTGHSLGGGLATVSAIRTGKPATVFDASGLGDAVLANIQADMANAGMANTVWANNAARITNFNLQGEFVSDGDGQQDADVIGVDSKQYGDIFYLSAARFTPIFFLNNGLTRHFSTPIKEELQFLSQPVFRVNQNDLNSIDNDINGFTALFYIDWTDDTLDLMIWQAEYAINSFPSFLEDL
ncbi:lipase family protein [Enterovibrio sp. 27052020O]|uniref:lipase family protein n=1 Tax=Enterovibrio sp. 27052020O TaxID=3241166 RepID=UPI00388E99E9